MQPSKRRMFCAVLLFLPLAAGALLHRNEDQQFSYPLQEAVVRYIKNNYVDPDRIEPREMLKSALDTIERFIPEILVTMGPDKAYFTVRVNEMSRVYSMATVEDLDDANRVIKDVFAFLAVAYKGETSLRDIQYASINGSLKALDPHSEYLTPDTLKEFQISTMGNFGGIGIVIGIKNGELTVIAPIEGTPAAVAGLKAGDRIVMIDGSSTVNMSLEEAVNKLRGKKGTSVSVGVSRKSLGEVMEVSIVRDIIQIKSVISKILPNQIGYIRITHFRKNTIEEFDQQLAHLKKQGVLRGLIVDLRDNPGGLLSQAVDLSDRFLKSGLIVSTVQVGAREEENAHAMGTEPPYPVAVLVNEGSASGSEIVAGALKYRDRAVLIGNSTFGKGTVQTIYNQQLDDRSALKLTIAKYLLPGDRSIQSSGINPDVSIRPAFVEKDQVVLFGESESFKEKDLAQHLKEEQRDEESAYALRYLHVRRGKDKGGEEEEDDGSGIYTGKVNLDRDFYVKVAQSLIASTRNWERPQLLQDGRKILEDLSRQEDGKIQQALLKLGVNWTPPPPSSGPAAPGDAVQARLTVSPDKEIRAGQDMKLTMTVTNRGQRPVHRIRGITAAEYQLLDQREFMFGRIDPGQQRSWTITIKVPEGIPSREDRVAVRLYADQLELPVSVPVLSTRIVEKPRPVFSYRYRLIDNPQQDKLVKGNGNGRLDIGEDVKLDLIIKNSGQGLSTNNLATLKNLSEKEVFITQGRGKPGRLPSGATAAVPFYFGVHPGFGDQSAQLQIAIMDLTYNIMLQDKVAVPVGSEAVASEPDFRLPPELVLTSPEVGKMVSDAKLKLRGVIRFQAPPRYFYVYHKEDKIYFQSLPDSPSGRELAWEVPIQLEKGANPLTLIVTGRDGLTSERVAVVTLADETPKSASADAPPGRPAAPPLP